ncbi:MAG TPA: histidinol dehydrogenase, partial [Acidimicrobiales bacterium]|nr:histidinol dehydrogenase [Acidimicrobiales bacterium]
MAQLLTRLDLRGVSGDLRALLPGPKAVEEGPVQVVKEILAAVKAGGDKAVAELTQRLDGVVPPSLRIPPEEIAAAVEQVSPELRTALEEAARAIRDFH